MRSILGESSVLAVLLIASLSIPVRADVYSATIFDGFGTGSYEAGTEVLIEAFPYEGGDPNQSTQEPADVESPLAVFDHWEGAIESVADPYAARTSLVMPARNVSLTAVFTALPRWTGPRVITEIPDGHIGVIFFFHGRGGGALPLFVQTETLAFIQEALSRGIGVVALDSYDRFEKSWQASPDPQENIDIQRTAALRRELIANGRMTRDDPVYVVGASNGGIFASLFTEDVQTAIDFPVDAAALYISSGDYLAMQSSTVPTVFALAQNDDATDPAMMVFSDLVTRGVPAQLWINPPRPLHPGSFWVIEGLALADSQAVFDALTQANIIDSEGHVTLNPRDDPRVGAAIPEAYSGQFHQIEDLLKLSYAEHGFMSDFNAQVLDFLVDPATLVPGGPDISGFEPKSGVPGELVNVYGAGFLAITSVAVGDVAASFSSVSSTQLRIEIPAGAETGPITVTNCAGIDTSSESLMVEAPSITDFSPESGPPNTLVQVAGSGFIDVTGVAVGGVPAEVTSYSSASLIIRVPVGAVDGPITVTNKNGTGTSQTDFSVAGPEITEISPASGYPGNRVTIYGTGFVEVSSVAFANVPAEILYSSATSLQVRVPTGAQTGAVSVSNYLGTALSPLQFEVLPPIIQSFSPTSGTVGTRVTVSGSGFDGLIAVKVHSGVPAEVLYATATTIRFRVPEGSATGPISVMTATGTATSAGHFTVN